MAGLSGLLWVLVHNLPGVVYADARLPEHRSTLPYLRPNTSSGPVTNPRIQEFLTAYLEGMETSIASQVFLRDLTSEQRASLDALLGKREKAYQRILSGGPNFLDPEKTRADKDEAEAKALRLTGLRQMLANARHADRDKKAFPWFDSAIANEETFQSKLTTLSNDELTSLFTLVDDQKIRRSGGAVLLNKDGKDLLHLAQFHILNEFRKRSDSDFLGKRPAKPLTEMTSDEIAQAVGPISNSQLTRIANHVAAQQQDLMSHFGVGRPEQANRLVAPVENLSDNLKVLYHRNAEELAKQLGVSYDKKGGYDFSKLQLSLQRLQSDSALRALLEKLNPELVRALSKTDRREALEQDRTTFLPPDAEGNIRVLSNTEHMQAVQETLERFFRAYGQFDANSREKNQAHGIWAEAYDYYFGSHDPTKRSQAEKLSDGWFDAMRAERKKLSDLGISKIELDVLDRQIIAALKKDTERAHDAAKSIEKDFYKELALSVVSAAGGLAARAAFAGLTSTSLLRTAAVYAASGALVGGATDVLRQLGENIDGTRRGWDPKQTGASALMTGTIGALTAGLVRYAPGANGVVAPFAVAAGIHEEGKAAIISIEQGKWGAALSHGTNTGLALLPGVMGETNRLRARGVGIAAAEGSETPAAVSVAREPVAPVPATKPVTISPPPETVPTPQAAAPKPAATKPVLTETILAAPHGNSAPLATAPKPAAPIPPPGSVPESVPTPSPAPAKAAHTQSPKPTSPPTVARAPAFKPSPAKEPPPATSRPYDGGASRLGDESWTQAMPRVQRQFNKEEANSARAFLRLFKVRPEESPEIVIHKVVPRDTSLKNGAITEVEYAGQKFKFEGGVEYDFSLSSRGAPKRVDFRVKKLAHGEGFEVKLRGDSGGEGRVYFNLVRGKFRVTGLGGHNKKTIPAK